MLMAGKNTKNYRAQNLQNTTETLESRPSCAGEAEILCTREASERSLSAGDGSDEVEVGAVQE